MPFVDFLVLPFCGLEWMVMGKKRRAMNFTVFTPLLATTVVTSLYDC